MANKPQNKSRNPGLGNFALGEKLRKFSPNIKTKFDDIRKVTDLGPDGEDHINVYMNCKTDLGAALSPFAIASFVNPIYGKFNSRQGFYYYLLSKDGHEAFRTMHPIKMRSYAAGLSTMGFFCPNLRYHMATALWSQIKDNESIKQKLIDNQLPFEAYYLKRQKFEDTVSLIPARPNGNAVWITRIVSVIANALKKGANPVFDEFIDDSEQLERLKAKITRPLTPPPAPKPKKEKVVKKENIVPTVETTSSEPVIQFPPIDKLVKVNTEVFDPSQAITEVGVHQEEACVVGGLEYVLKTETGTDRDFFNIWTSGTQSSPINHVDEAGYSNSVVDSDAALPAAEGMKAVEELREVLNESEKPVVETNNSIADILDQTTAEQTN